MTSPMGAQSNSDLINELKKSSVFHSNEIHRAMSAIDRADFCGDDPYTDSSKPIGYDTTISAPHMHATALEGVIDVIKSDSHILDVDCGSAYLTACFSQLIGPNGLVVGIANRVELADLSEKNVRKHNADLLESGQIKFVVGDKQKGFPDAAPYDVIHVGSATSELPQQLVDQLAIGGRMLIPAGDEHNQKFLAVEKLEDGSVQERVIAHVVYVPLTDAEKERGQSFY